MSSNGRRSLFRFRIRTILLFLVLVIVAWSAFSYWTEYQEIAERKAREMLAPAHGAQCTAIFRRTELGVETSRLFSAEVDSVGNSVSGKFVQLNDQWLVLTSLDTEEEYWIPREHVLLLRVER